MANTDNKPTTSTPAAGSSGALSSSDQATKDKNAEGAGELTQEEHRAAVERKAALERAQLERPSNRESVFFNDNGSVRPAIVAHVHDINDEDPEAGYVNLSVLNEDGTWQPKQKVRRGEVNGQWTREDPAGKRAEQPAEKTATTAKTSQTARR